MSEARRLLAALVDMLERSNTAHLNYSIIDSKVVYADDLVKAANEFLAKPLQKKHQGRAGMIETEEDIKTLKSICQRIGYGNACDIICKAWDEMLKESYGLKPYHGDNWVKQKRSAIEVQEGMQEVINTLKSQIQDNCNHDWNPSPIAGDGYKCFKCGAIDLKDD